MDFDIIVLLGEKKNIGVVCFVGVLDKEMIVKVKMYFKDKYGIELNVSIVLLIVGKELVRNVLYVFVIVFIGIIIYVLI